MQRPDALRVSSSTPLALPRAYWLYDTLGAQLLPITPSVSAFSRIQDAISKAKSDEYDMDIINRLYGKSAMVLPHRSYTILTSGSRRSEKENHSKSLGGSEEEWDTEKVLREVRNVHFSDWPLPELCTCHSHPFKKGRSCQKLMGR